MPAFTFVFFLSVAVITPSEEVIHDVFILFASAKVDVIWFDSLVSDHQSLALQHI